MRVGTIGPARCEICLSEILVEINDPKITRLIMHRHNDLRETLERLKPLAKTEGRWFFLRMAKLVWRAHKLEFETVKHRLPLNAYTFAMNCYTLIYRRAIQKNELGTTQEAA